MTLFRRSAVVSALQEHLPTCLSGARAAARRRTPCAQDAHPAGQPPGDAPRSGIGMLVFRCTALWSVRGECPALQLPGSRVAVLPVAPRRQDARALLGHSGNGTRARFSTTLPRRALVEGLALRLPGPRGLLGACLCLLGLVLQPALAAESAVTPDPAKLQLASVQAAVARLEAADGDYLVTKQAERSVPIASVTKLMTALVVRESGAEMEEWLTIVEREKKPENNGFSHLRVGSELRRRDLLRIMLQASENLASYVLAAHYPGGYDAFVAAMNARAAELGMTGTRYVGTSGLSPANLSTAADLVRLARVAYRDPVIREYSTGGYFEARFRNPRYSLTYGNTNPLTHSSRWDVRMSKTGYLTEAGRCLVMVTVVDGEELIVVLLDSFGKRTPLGDSGRIRRWLTTGDSGSVAAAAARYARDKEATYLAQEAAGQ